MPSFFRRTPEEGLALFARAPTMTISGVDARGLPVLRVVNGVVREGKLYFHGGNHGEKKELLDGPVVVVAHEIVASIPSYFVDPTLACPASTFYRSAIAHGSARRLEEPRDKAWVLESLMERFQAEGGYAPIHAEDARYATMLRKLLVAEIVPERITAKHKLGQNRTGAEITKILEGLFTRGGPGDLLAIRSIREAHAERPTPAFLEAPPGFELCVAPDERDARAISELLAPTYWSEGYDFDIRRAAQLGSGAWVVARDADSGETIGSARAVSDGARFANVLDVVVDPRFRGRGVGSALMRLLLDHPRLRETRRVTLRTRDAVDFYARLGFGAGQGSFQELVRVLP